MGRSRNLAKRSVVVSDLSGEEIEEGKGALVTIRFNDARKGTIVLDVTDAEAESMGTRAASGSAAVDVLVRLPEALIRSWRGCPADTNETSVRHALSNPVRRAGAGMSRS
jgi:hypothetical protein